MYIAIYLVVIFCFCALAIAIFFYFRNKEKRKLEEINNGKKSKSVEKTEPQLQTESDLGVEFTTDEELSKTKPTVQAEFEDFTLDLGEEKIEKSDPQTVNLENKRSSLEDKFAEYERFLQRHMGRKYEESGELDTGNISQDDFDEFDEFDDEPNNVSELDALANFDFDMLKNKSESEIDEIISRLPEKAQQILREDILGRRDVD